MLEMLLLPAARVDLHVHLRRVLGGGFSQSISVGSRFLGEVGSVGLRFTVRSEPACAQRRLSTRRPAPLFGRLWPPSVAWIYSIRTEVLSCC